MQIFLTAIIFIFLWILLWTIVLALRYYKYLALYWNEPVINFPVLIFESDDWGPGIEAHGHALDSISEILSKYTDSEGRHPVMTLGVVLAVPDAKKIRDSDGKTYHASFLNEAKYALIKTAMLNGVGKSVFDLQLHGLEHYWPDNLMAALQKDSQIKMWLESTSCPETECLPSELQSRWIDTKHLPSRPLNSQQIKDAVNNEVKEFAVTFGFKPKVVVPPTFVWDATVENEWSKHALQYLVTPGRCFDARDKDGKPSSSGAFIYNGQRSESGLTYIVRNDYFEPCLGHTAEMAIKSLENKTRLAQPTLLEIHRFNFIQTQEQRENSLRELDHCIELALEKFPNLKFLSTFELAEMYASNNNSTSLEKEIGNRMLVFLTRIWSDHAIKKWLIISGLFIPVLGLIKRRKP